MQKKIKKGARLTAFFVILIMLVNSLLPTYGDIHLSQTHRSVTHSLLSNLQQTMYSNRSAI